MTIAVEDNTPPPPEPIIPGRRVIQLAPLFHGSGYYEVLALCEDGTIWRGTYKHWERMDGPPGSP